MKNRSPFGLRRAQPKNLVINTSDTNTEILMYDEIGFWGITAKDFAVELSKITTETITLRINSPGGSVFDGVAIFTALQRHPARVIVYVDGLAASIASLIAMAGDEIYMSENSFMMIHNAWTFSIGNAGSLRKDAALLDKIDGNLVAAYAKRTELPADELATLMADETWFTADDAVEHGFADGIEPVLEPSNKSYDLSVFGKVPPVLQRSSTAPPTIRDLEVHLRDAGLSRSDAKAVLAGGYNNITQRDADEGLDDVLQSAQILLDAMKPTLHKK